MVDTGAATSVVPSDYFTYVPLRKPAYPTYLTSVTGAPIQVYGYRDVTLTTGRFSLPMTFTVAEVQTAILGIDALHDTGATLHIQGDYSTVTDGFGNSAYLHHYGSHYYLKTAVVSGHYGKVNFADSLLPVSYTHLTLPTIA